MRAGSERVAIVIPAYQPDGALGALVRELLDRVDGPIVIVNDGSTPDRAPIFTALARLPRLTVLKHAVNVGKGQALKTGFAFVMEAMPDIAGVVTADADGQHLPADVAALVARLVAQPDRLVLGHRRLDARAPWRSRVGNALTRRVFHLLLGRWLADTQTGLRGVPASLLPVLLGLASTGYDFELDALVRVAQLGLAIDELPIAAIYEDGNRTSHFDPLRDSVKVSCVFVRVAAAAIAAAAIGGLKAAAAGQLALAETE